MIGTRDFTGKSITQGDLTGDPSQTELITEPVGLDFNGFPVVAPNKPHIGEYDVYAIRDFSYFGTPS